MPASLSARIALILFAGLLSAQLASLWLQSAERESVVAQARGLHFADRLAETVRVVEAAAPAQRAGALAALQASDWRVTLIAAEDATPGAARGQMPANLAARLGSEREVRAAGGMGGRSGGGSGFGGGMGPPGGRATTMRGPRSVDVRLDDGRWLRVVASGDAATPALPPALLAQLVVTLLIVTVVVIVAVRLATTPLRRLAHAADSIGEDLDAAPLEESGPRETRLAAQAFNRMQQRIRDLVAERSRALAAISHDLRTPLTRLRLRSELVSDEALRSEIAADLDGMAALLDASLDYLRSWHDDETARRIDIDALVHSIADDAAVIGRRISVEGKALAPFCGRLTALRRALQNLVDNAIKYGENARIRIEDSEKSLSLVVEDEGPGIAEAELAKVVAPYYRPAASHAGTSGVGLGLSIVNHCALAHGGELVLANRPQGGLVATLVLPRKTDGFIGP